LYSTRFAATFHGTPIIKDYLCATVCTGCNVFSECNNFSGERIRLAGAYREALNFLAWAAIIWHIDVDICIFRVKEIIFAVMQSGFAAAKKS
jgi:hypothetical protein